MKEIKVQCLSDEAFRKSGVYQKLTADAEMKNRVIPCGDFYPDLLTLDFGKTTLPTVSCCHVYKQDRMVVDFLEYHKYTCEGLVPLDDDVIIYVGVPEMGELRIENLEGFYVPKHTFVKLNPMIVHGGQYPVNEPEAHLICMLPGRTFQNDMVYLRIEEEDKKGVLIMQEGNDHV